MQKKLIALAVAAAASSAAFAQSNVTIYGLLQPSYDFMKNSTASGADFNEMSWNNSRIGFKGEENLGNGLKAIFQIETNVALTERGSQDALGGDRSGFGSRDSWVGISSASLGTVTFGNHQSAYVRTSASYDPFADSIGDYNNIMGTMGGTVGGFALGGDDYFNKRRNKSAYYTSPTIAGGLVLTYSHAMNGTDTDGAASIKTNSFAANYKLGALDVFGAYEKSKTVEVEDVTPINADLSGWKMGARYNFGATSVFGIYEKLKAKDVASTDDTSVKHYYIGATHKIGNIDLLATYIRGSNYDGLSNSTARNYNLGARYNLSKRTNVLAVYTNLRNDDNAIQAVDSNGAGGAAGTTRGFSVRLQHAF